MTLLLKSVKDRKRGRMRLDGMSRWLSTTSVRKAWRKCCELEGQLERQGKRMLWIGREANGMGGSGRCGVVWCGVVE
jgi:hypothetical protein